MAFVKSLAKGGLFGLSGLAATAGSSNNKTKPSPSLVTGDFPTTLPPNPSLLNSKSGYQP